MWCCSANNEIKTDRSAVVELFTQKSDQFVKCKSKVQSGQSSNCCSTHKFLRLLRCKKGMCFFHLRIPPRVFDPPKSLCLDNALVITMSPVSSCHSNHCSFKRDKTNRNISLVPVPLARSRPPPRSTLTSKSRPNFTYSRTPRSVDLHLQSDVHPCRHLTFQIDVEFDVRRQSRRKYQPLCRVHVPLDVKFDV